MRTYQPTYKDKKGKTKKVNKWWVEVRDHNEIVRRFAGFTDRRLTEKLGGKIEKLINYKVLDEPPDLTLSRWLENVPTKLRDRFVKIGLLDGNRAAASKPLTEHLEDFKLSLLAKAGTTANTKQVISRLKRIFAGCNFRTWTDISANRVVLFLADLRNNGMGLGDTTSNYYLKSAKQFCRWMVENRRASESPLAHLRSLEAMERHKRRAFEPNEVRRLLEAAEAGPYRYGMTGHERAVLYRLAAETGLRRVESKRLTVSALDFGNCTITVVASRGKNREDKIMPLKKDTAALLQGFVAGKLPAVKVFDKIHNRTADMIKADLAATEIKDNNGKTIKEAIPYIDDAGRYGDFYALRHTFITSAHNTSTSVQQSLARHKSPRMTARYDHPRLYEERKVVDALPDYSLPSKEKRQAIATGTDDLAENLSSMGDKHRLSANGNEQTKSPNDAITPITPHQGGQKTTRKSLTA